ncbi:13582_t:CDS:1, partial [Gigaspora margarita]
GDLAMLAVVQVIYSQAHYLLCIYHIGIKKTKSKLSRDKIKSFIEDFYCMHNSYSLHQFELRYNEMLKKYEQCQGYFERKLYPSQEM